MANRQLRPLHRFAGLPRQPAPTVIPRTVEPQEPRPSTLVQPTFTSQTTQPSSEPTRQPPPPSTDRVPSPKFKPSTDSAPPPPSSLPQAREELKSKAEPEARIPLVSEPKTVLVQKTVDRPLDHFDKQTQKPSFTARDGKEDQWRKELEADKNKGTTHKKLSDSEQEVLGKRFITIAGENKGAFMEVVRVPNKLGGQDKTHVLYKNGHRVVEPSGGEKEYIKNEEGKKDKHGQKGKGTHSTPLTAFTNSNVQGVNNSIVFNSSCKHNNPGVRYAYSRKPAVGGKGIQVKDLSGGQQI